MVQSAYVASGIFLSALAYWLKTRSRPKLPLPPGPRKFPLIGNLLDLPTTDQWLTFTDWAKRYDSDIVHAEAAGYSFIILNSYEAMTELLDKRSSIYSSRALSRVIYEMVGWNWLMVLMPYNEAWKERRRLFAKYFHPSDTSLHRVHETEQLHILLNLLMKEPADFLKHIRHVVGATTIRMAYGIQVKPTHDPYVGIAENTIDGLSKALLPGTFLAESFWWLRHIPEGIPGTGWKARVRTLQQEMYDFLDKPFEAALDAISKGTSTDSFVSRCQQDINEGKLSQEEQKLVKDMAAQVFIAGAETTVSAISSFFLALACFPDVYKKAQAEVDSVLKGRLSEDADIESMPYLNAMLKEVLRWQPVFPMGIFHSVMRDDEYRGYHIPADSLVVPNIWGLSYDQELFPEPQLVKPERFLRNGKVHVSGPDPTEITFGFGRRTCQGRHIAESTMFHIAASVLSLFDITKAKDIDGKVIEPSCDYTSGIARQPAPFKCTIQPRSQTATNLIHSDVVHAEAAGYSFIILNSYEAIVNLLDRRSAIYSSRIGWKWLMVLMPYNEAWREQRRLFAKYINPSDTSLHKSHETEQLHNLLNLLMTEPDDFLKHIRHVVGATTISMTYGIKVQSTNDPYVNLAEDTTNGLSRALIPGQFLVETFWWLRHIPEGLPGTGWKAKIRVLQQQMHDFLNVPFEAALKAIENGTSMDSFVSRCRQDSNEGKLADDEHNLVKDTAALIFMGGAETTVSVISTFVLAIVCFPDVYSMAQAEVDNVLKGRLSEDSDIDSLPYLKALLKEVVRWQPVFPMGIYHAVIRDDEYKGYHIPANSLVIPNIWGLFYDPELFPEPDKVKPERFLQNGQVHVSGPDPTEMIFGFGRR
ncbi:hypothetical protein NP233_g9884 [Leucocoprinus birnbaumii]|uniref:Cytochrome P450 n=1 Tax=Leucocoprinus birnbaumii TaxID=56174 RepID=A0AAD5YSG5_9AGAR|nr:hypothetical protein NP233_g9884 [Leucocoprinus birnbaumii]